MMQSTYISNRNDTRGQNAFALLSAVWFSAILSVLSLSIVGIFLANTHNISRETQRIQSDLLHDAALKYTVLDLLKARSSVALGGVPNASLSYQNRITAVNVSVQNEAAFLDLNLLPASVLKPIFEELGLDLRVIDEIDQHQRSTQNSEFNFRWLKALLAQNDSAFKKITGFTSFYNGSKTVNQDVVSEKLLRALPDLSSIDASDLIDTRNAKTKSLIGNAINHPMLSNRASSHYRVTTSLNLGNITSSKTRIINITSPESPRLFKVVAEL